MESKVVSEVEDEIFGEGKIEKLKNPDKMKKKQSNNLINDSDEPSKDIDLGSVQEV